MPPAAEVTRVGAEGPADGLVSVIIPTFNSRGWIRETVDSALGQTYADVEVVVADNGSTDGTLDAIRAYGDRVRLVHAAERGAGAARNAGLDAARGTYLQFLDSDDVLEPDKVGRAVTAARATGADVVWAPFWTLERPAPGAPFQKCRRRQPVIGHDVARSLLAPTGFVQIGATLVRRTARTAAVRFDNAEACPTEDVRYLLDLALAGARFERADGDSGLLFRQHELYRWSAGSRVRFWASCAANARAVENAWRARRELTPDRIAVLTEVYLNAARAFYGEDRSRFGAIVAHLHALDPSFVRRLPTRLRLVARLIGYPRTEAAAAGFRAIKAALRPRATAEGVRR